MQYKIKEYRLSKNITQTELAEKVGCSRQYLNELENKDIRNVSSHLLLRIANALDVSVEKIFLDRMSDISD
nr:MAG TPA: Helix-turn-helix XRE-family like protein [Caudoviricetes sp.]